MSKHSESPPTEGKARGWRVRPMYALGVPMTLLAFVLVEFASIAWTTAYAAGNGACEVTSEQEREAFTLSVDQQWQTISATAITPNAGTHQIAQLEGGIAYVDNNLGAIMALPPQLAQTATGSTANGTDFEPMRHATVVTAIYDPQTSTGSIYVDRTMDIDGYQGQPGVREVMETLPFTPEDGIEMSSAYDNNNPFWQFVPGLNGNPGVQDGPDAFVKVGPNAFFAAVGMVMKWVDAQRGLIATLNVHTQEIQHKSGGIFVTHVHVTENAYVKPSWTLVLPSGEAPSNSTTGYKLPICNPNNFQPLIVGSSTQATQDAQLYSTALTEGGPTSVGYNGQTWAALTIPAGVEYINMGSNPINLQTGQWLFYQHEKTYSGLGFIGLLVIAVVVSVVTWGAGAAAVGAISGTAEAAMTTAYGAVGLSAVTGAAATGAVFSAAATLIQSALGNNGFPGNASDTVFIGQDDNKGTDPDISAYNLNQYLASLYSVDAVGGVVDNADADGPTSQMSSWNGYIGTASEVANPGNNRNTGSYVIGSTPGEESGTMGYNTIAAQAQTTLANSAKSNSSQPSLYQQSMMENAVGTDGGTTLPAVPQIGD